MPTYVDRILSYEVGDGDTIKVVVDLGYHISHTVRLRLDGIDTPESNVAGQRAAAEVCAAAVRWWLSLFELEDLRIESHALGKYGRTIGDIVDAPSEKRLIEWLLREGLAKPLGSDGKRERWTDDELLAIEKKGQWM